jgi:pimeloyl-ACP methyl ester carboxylesterase
MKKLISVLLVCSMLLVVLAPAAFAAKVTRVSTPVVFVGGQEDYIYSDKDDAESDTYITGDLPKEALDEITAAIRPQLTDAFVGKWDGYTDGFYRGAMPYYENIVLDGDGLPINDTGYDCLKPEQIVDKGVNGRYGLYDYQFIYDWRLDPIANADELNAFINEVLSVTGADKLDIVAQGIGCSTVLAYLANYGSAKISELVMDNAALEGSDVYGAMFSSGLTIDSESEALAVFVAEARRNNTLLQVVKHNINPESWETLGSVKATRRVYAKIYEMVIPRIMRSVYATMPGVWSLIPDAYFNSAIDGVFTKYEEDENTEGFSAKEYAGLIEKINAYHTGVAVHTAELLQAAAENGVNVYLIANYGFQMIPVNAAAGQSDVYISVGSQTLGVTAADYGKTFDEDYLEEADEAYISADQEIDASTGAYADHTWLIKNLEYREKPEVVDDLIISILNFNGYTNVADLEEYPQYLFCSKDRADISPLKETGDSEYQETETENETSNKLTLSNFFDFVKSFIEAIVRLVTTVIKTGQSVEIGDMFSNAPITSLVEEEMSNP